MTLWQIAAGEPGRDYRKLFFDHDLMLLGPSDRGDASDSRYQDRSGTSGPGQVHRFATGPEPGDRVVARLRKEVIGVGEIPPAPEGDYTFDETFRSVYGWSLCHTRRVVWAEDADLGAFDGVFESVKRKPSFTAVDEPHIVAPAAAFGAEYFDRPLRPMPEVDTTPYTDEELGVELFRAGISNRNIEDILAALRQAERLCSWYRSEAQEGRPTEHEVVSHVVLPIFLALGWSHQQIAVEWKKTDMAFFKRTPTTPENCVMVLEAKGLGSPLNDRVAQPQKYVERSGLGSVKYVLTTDGPSVFLYERDADGWADEPTGHLDVTTLQRSYLLPEGTNPVETLVRLQPSAV